MSGLSSEGSDYIARLVTGDLVERRKLYSNAELVTIKYRRTGIITGIAIPRGTKPDALDRLIPIKSTAPKRRLSEAELNAKWAARHPRVLGAVLDLAVKMLAGEGKNPAGLRNADYAEALWAMDPALYQAYADNITHTRGEMASEDPFIATFVAWLSKQADQSWRGNSTDAWNGAGAFVGLTPTHSDTWWPSTPRGMSEAINKNVTLLEASGVEVRSGLVKGKTQWRFKLVSV